jgi:pimeloyl-ACP methyl ester carboxylesterase
LTAAAFTQLIKDLSTYPYLKIARYAPFAVMTCKSPSATLSVTVEAGTIACAQSGDSSSEEDILGTERIHRTKSYDGTEIAGRVHGSGPALVLVHGGGGNGEVSWQFLLPYLTPRFTCYTMSTRGRGLSANADMADHSIDRLVDDVVAFTESIGEPVGAVGHSSSLTLAAAARGAPISAMAVYEPAVSAVPGENPDRVQDAFVRMMTAADEGQYKEAVRIFFEESGLFNEDETAALSAKGMYELMALNVPAWCSEMSEYAGATEASVLERVEVPVLLLQGTRSPSWFVDSVRYVERYLADVRVAEVPGGGHMGTILVPEIVADALIQFFSQRVASG